MNFAHKGQIYLPVVVSGFPYITPIFSLNWLMNTILHPFWLADAASFLIALLIQLYYEPDYLFILFKDALHLGDSYEPCGLDTTPTPLHSSRLVVTLFQ